MRLFKILFCMMIQFGAISQNNYSISGYVTDKETGETLIGVAIFDTETELGISTNNYGFYSLSLKSDTARLLFSYLGFETYELNFKLIKNETFNVALDPRSTMIDEVTISAVTKQNPVTMNGFNISVLSPKSIKELPVIFGEADIIKGVQLQTGVSSLGEGSSGMFVQGGNTDQNLIIIDEAPIYNPSHLFGLVSVFNPDAIKNVNFYKGSMPAEYGGRISSVLDCQMIDGNKYKHQFSGGIGTLTAHVALEGPIKKGSSSYLVAARRSIRDLFQKPDAYTSYVPEFYDFNAKINWTINNKNRLFFSVYTGKDKIATNNDFTNSWGNNSVTLRWNRTLSARLFLNISFVYSNYINDWNYLDKSKNYNWKTGIEDFGVKLDLNWFISPVSEFKCGLSSTYHQFIPGENSFPDQSLFRINALENSAFLQHDITLASWLGVNYGLRFSLFQNIGKGQWYEYSGHTPVGIIENKQGVYQSYSNIEPRITVNIKPGSKQVFKLSYVRTAQYYQIIQNSIFSYTSLQTWLPANPNLKALQADMFAVGYFVDINDEYSLSAEAYHKTTYNVVDFVDHAELINNPYIETQLKSGKAEAYGISVEFKYETQKLSGSISYTYSVVNYKVDGINNNDAYPALQNIPNDIRIRMAYKPNKRIGINAFWTLHSGFAVNLPVGYVVSDPANEALKIPVYTAKNAGKMPVYHRLDLSINLYPKESNKRWKSTWSAGVFNAYNRFNPIGVDLTESQGGQEQAYFYTIYRVIPYISYNFKF